MASMRASVITAATIRVAAQVATDIGIGHLGHLRCDGTDKALDLGDEGRRHRPHECAVADTEVDLIADRDRVIAEVYHQVVAAHPEDPDAFGWLQAVRVHVLATE